MKPTAAIIAGIILLILSAQIGLAQQYRPPWEIRTYLGPGPQDPNPTAVYTDTTGTATWQYNMSKVMGRWVCPKCGYSTPVVLDPTNPPYCPNPWMVPNHGNVRLRFQPIKRCFVSTTGEPVTDPSGNPVFAILGKPFHPRTPTGGASNPDERGSAVHIAVAGLHESHDVIANNTTGDFVRFLVLQPGAKYPAAKATVLTSENGLGLDDASVRVNPFRVTDGETFHVQVFFATDWLYTWFFGWRPLHTVTVVRVYSDHEGLVFYGVHHDWMTEHSFLRDNDLWIVTANGAAVIRIPEDLGRGDSYVFGNENPPPNIPAGRSVTDPALFSTIRVRSNCRIIPAGEDTTAGPSAWDAFPPQWAQMGNPCNVQDWPFLRNYFRIPADGRVADWINNVVGTGAPVAYPYVIDAGAVGKGTIWAEWQRRGAHEAGIPPYSGIIDNPQLVQSDTVNGQIWWWVQHAEWNYDWLEESGSAAPYGDLWGNCRAVVYGTDLEAVHTPTNAGPYRDTDPPWEMKSSFISSRIQIPPTGDQWQHGSTTEPAELDTDPNCGHAVVVIGEVHGGVVSGSYQPGSRTVDRYVRVDGRGWGRFRCPACGTIQTGPHNTCPYCGVNVGSSNMRRWDEYARACIDVDVAPGIDLPQSPRSGQPAHVAIPTTAMDVWPHIGWFGPADFDRRFRIAYDLPKYLPPSAPPGANPAMNDFDHDAGYRGRLLLFNRPHGSEASPDFTGHSLQRNWHWDASYRCPACGTWQNASGDCAYGACNGTKVCPVCFVQCHHSLSTCPFCGHNLRTWGRTDTFAGLPRVRPDDIDCEEYEVFEVVVSVMRKLELASKVAGLDLGRVAPGVRPDQPDVTVGNTPAAEPTPSEVSPPAETAIINEGNISIAATMRGTVLTREATDLGTVSLEYQALRHPLTIGTIYAASQDGTRISDSTPLLAPTQEPGAAEGLPAGAWLRAGWLLPTSYKPVPLGQPAGIHTGTAIFFQDLDGDGALRFYDRSTGTVTDTYSEVFDPQADLPLEPVASLDLRVRVAEAPVPDNDYFAPDFAPAIGFRYDSDWSPDELQVLFGSTRPPGPAVGQASGRYLSPPGSAAEAQARAQQPVNLFYLSASRTTDPGDPLYERYQWRTTGPNVEPAHTLTMSDEAGAVNGSPSLVDRRYFDHNWLALWHRARPTERGWEMTLRANVTANVDYAASNETFMFTGRNVKGLRGISVSGQVWAFWHTGKPGQERIFYLRNFDPAHPRDGDELPVSNSYGSRPHHEAATVWLSGPTIATVTAHKPSRSPFVYVKDPSPWVWGEYLSNNNVDAVLNVVFSGYVRRSGNADICWVKFRQHFMGNPDHNWGKKAFKRLEHRFEIAPPLTRTNAGDPATGIWVGEEMSSDEYRQTFWTRHLDWVVHDNGPGHNFGNQPDPALQDPRMYLVVVQDTDGDGQPPTLSVYEVTWQHTDERWNRTRNAYIVEPRFQLLRGPDVLAAFTYPGDSAPYRLVDPPTARQPQPRPLMMEINHAAGTVRFSSPLFNTLAPGDTTAVVNTSAIAQATDVVMYIDYTPMIWRITTDPADDDCPWAYNARANGYLAIFWRRTYPASEPPHWGRSSFMYKLWAPAVVVRHPPMPNNFTVEHFTNGAYAPVPSSNYDAYPAAGMIRFRYMYPADLPWAIRVTYGPYTDLCVAPGWTKEYRVPVDTQLVSGPFSVAMEPRRVHTPSGNIVESARFWLTWSSPRALLDLRPVANGGGAIRQSSDVYTAVVAPDLASMVAEPLQMSISPDPT